MKKILLILMVLFAFIACDNGSSGSDDGQALEGGGGTGNTNDFVGQWVTEDGKTLIFDSKAANQPGRVTGTLLTTEIEDEDEFYYITSSSTLGVIRKGSANGTQIGSIRILSGKLQLVSGFINNSSPVSLTKQ
ncbi:MAG: hypothetical protein J6K76_07635 [Spirochaetaceae bacterium]|nr:hypothetical protein [Spirochaetaceae bacterium]